MAEEAQPVEEVDPVAAAMSAATGAENLEAAPAETTGKEVVPPASDQAGDQAAEETTTGATTPSDEQGLKDVSDDELQRALADQLGTSAEETEEKIKRDLAASSKEARRLNDVVKSVQETLAAQGIELSLTEDGAFEGLRATGTPNAEKFPSAPKVDSDMQDRLFQDAQAEVDRVWAEAHKAAQSHYARPDADLESVSHPPSQEVLAAAQGSVKDSKDVYGTSMYPNYERLEPVVGNMVETLPPALREAYNEHPETILRLLHDSAENARSRLIQGVKAENAKKQEQKAKAEGDASLQPGGDATIHVGGGGAGAAAALAEHIAKAELV